MTRTHRREGQSIFQRLWCLIGIHGPVAIKKTRAGTFDTPGYWIGDYRSQHLPEKTQLWHQREECAICGKLLFDEILTAKPHHLAKETP